MKINLQGKKGEHRNEGNKVAVSTSKLLMLKQWRYKVIPKIMGIQEIVLLVGMYFRTVFQKTIS